MEMGLSSSGPNMVVQLGLGLSNVGSLPIAYLGPTVKNQLLGNGGGGSEEQGEIDGGSEEQGGSECCHVSWC